MRSHYLNQHRIAMSTIEWLKVLVILENSEPLNKLFDIAMHTSYLISTQNVPDHLEL